MEDADKAMSVGVKFITSPVTVIFFVVNSPDVQTTSPETVPKGAFSASLISMVLDNITSATLVNVTDEPKAPVVFVDSPSFLWVSRRDRQCFSAL